MLYMRARFVQILFSCLVSCYFDSALALEVFVLNLRQLYRKESNEEVTL